MPKPVVLTANFQVTNVDNDLLVCNVSWVYSVFCSQQSVEKTWAQNENLNGNYLLARSSRVRLLSCSRLLKWTRNCWSLCIYIYSEVSKINVE